MLINSRKELYMGNWAYSEMSVRKLTVGLTAAG